MSSHGKSIGATPLQMAAAMSAIANGGTLYELQYPRTPEEIENLQPLVRERLDDLVCRLLHLTAPPPNMSHWQDIIRKLIAPQHRVRIGVVGKYIELHDAYKSVYEAIIHGGIANDCGVVIDKVDAEEIEKFGAEKMLKGALVLATLLYLAVPLPAAAILKKGDPAPPLKVVSTSGQNITLANYKGHVLVMDFFATWCPPCREAIPHLIELNRKYNKQGLQVLGLSTDEDGEQVVREFVAEKRITYPVALASEEVLTDYSLRSIPTAYVISKKGIVAEKYMGFNDEMAKSMEALIKKLLAE